MLLKIQDILITDRPGQRQCVRYILHSAGPPGCIVLRERERGGGERGEGEREREREREREGEGGRERGGREEMEIQAACEAEPGVMQGGRTCDSGPCTRTTLA